VESDQKDLIIAQLKAELFELKQSEKKFFDKKEELDMMEQKYKVLFEENVRGTHVFALKFYR